MGYFCQLLSAAMLKQSRKESVLLVSGLLISIVFLLAPCGSSSKGNTGVQLCLDTWISKSSRRNTCPCSYKLAGPNLPERPKSYVQAGPCPSFSWTALSPLRYVRVIACVRAEREIANPQVFAGASGNTTTIPCFCSALLHLHARMLS